MLLDKLGSIYPIHNQHQLKKGRERNPRFAQKGENERRTTGIILLLDLSATTHGRSGIRRVRGKTWQRGGMRRDGVARLVSFVDGAGVVEIAGGFLDGFCFFG